MEKYIVVAVPTGRSLDSWRRTDPFSEIITGDSIEEVAKAFYNQRHRQDFRLAAVIREEDLLTVKKTAI